MNTLFRRELRRQSPAALAVFALGELISTGFYCTRQMSQDEKVDALFATLAIVALGAPFILALNSAAPDAENGGAAFLGRLPLSRRKELGVRWIVAALLALVTTAATAVVPVVIAGLRPDRQPSLGIDELVRNLRWTLPVLAFTVGAVASTAIGRTLHAVVFAPFFIVAIVPVGFIAAASGSSWAPSIGLATIGATLFAAAAAAHLTGDVHRRSMRPLLMAARIILVVDLLASLLGGTAYAYRRTIGRETDVTFGQESPRAGLLLETETGRRDEAFRFRVADMAARKVGPWIDGSPRSDDAIWSPLGFSPSGNAVLTSDYRAPERLALIDAATARVRVVFQGPPEAAFWGRRILALTKPWAGGPNLNVTGPGPASYWSSLNVVWRGDEPLLVGTTLTETAGQWEENESSLYTHDLKTALDGLCVSAAGSRILLRPRDPKPDEPLSLTLVDVSGDSVATRPLSLPAGLTPLEGRLAPSGRKAVFVVRDAFFVPSLLTVDLPTIDSPRFLPLIALAGTWEHLSSVTIDLSPSERRAHLAVGTSSLPAGGSHESFHDLETGAQLAEPTERLRQIGTLGRITWSPSERRVAVTPETHFEPVGDGRWEQRWSEAITWPLDGPTEGRKIETSPYTTNLIFVSDDLLWIRDENPRFFDASTGAMRDAPSQPWVKEPR